MREVADVHRELFAEHADLYGEDVRLKLERCLAVRDSDVERGSASGREYRGGSSEAMWGLDLVLTPTLPIVAPPLGARCRRPGGARIADPLHVPFSALGWPALALPCGAGRGRTPGVPSRSSARRGRRARARSRPAARGGVVTPELEFALSLADDADAITLARFGASDLRVETKAGSDARSRRPTGPSEEAPA